MRRELETFSLSGAAVVKPAVNVGIIGIGGYVPEKVLKNEDFVHVHMTEEEKAFFYSDPNFPTNERRYAGKESGMEMAVKAAKDALETYSIDPLSIDVVITTSSSKDMSRLAPPNANYVQTAIGADNAFSFIVDCGFNGWLHAVTTAAAYLSSGLYKRALVVSGETILSSMDARSSEILFMGDGAGAWVMESQKEEGILSFHHMARECVQAAGVKVDTAWGNYWSKESLIKPYLYVAPESFGRDLPVLEKYIPHSIYKSLDFIELTPQDVDLFIFGQQFKGLNVIWSKELEVGYEKVYETIASFACMKCASIPVTLWDAVKKGKVKKGDVLAFGDQGANWSISSAVIKWNLD